MANRKLIGGIGIGIIALLIWIAGAIFMKSQEINGYERWDVKAEDGSGFSIIPAWNYKDIYDVYESVIEKGDAPFITTDLVLHSARRFFSFALRTVEIKVCYPHLVKLSTALAVASSDLHKSLPPGEIRDAAKGLTAYCSVGAKILYPEFPLQSLVKEEVLGDLNFIEKHSGFELSKTLPYLEDFTQYAPRGHYTINKQFQQYFKTMMWFGRRLFRIEELNPGGMGQGEVWNDDAMIRETRQLLLLTHLLEVTKIDDKLAFSLWKNIFEALGQFTGPTEDLDVISTQRLAKKIWGKIPSPADLMDKDKILHFIELAKKATQPKIDNSGTGRKGFSLFGQRFTPDSYIMQSLVSSRGSLKYSGDQDKRPFSCGFVTGFGLARTFPRGLDILAALGSNTALQILKETGDSAYDSYSKKMSVLQQEIPEIIEKDIGESAFYGMLNSLVPLMKEPEGKALPGLFHTRSWALKESSTALGAWVEFRHDMVLYAKQSYTATGSALIGSGNNGYVEPYPEFYRRISQTISHITMIIKSYPELSNLISNFQQFEEVMGRLSEISDKEINGRALSEQDYQDISQFVIRLKSMTKFPPEADREVGLNISDAMALITDVHTDINSKTVLEEGIGPPFIIQVQIKKEGRINVFKGGIYSYFEFKQPAKDRLTDEKWQKSVLKDKGLTLLPDWYKYFLKPEI